MRHIKSHVNKGWSFVLVLHDLNCVARYADYVVAMKQGEVFTAGNIEEVFNEKLLSNLYETDIKIVQIVGYPMALSCQEKT